MSNESSNVFNTDNDFSLPIGLGDIAITDHNCLIKIIKMWLNIDLVGIGIIHHDKLLLTTSDSADVDDTLTLEDPFIEKTLGKRQASILLRDEHPSLFQDSPLLNMHPNINAVIAKGLGFQVGAYNQLLFIADKAPIEEKTLSEFELIGQYLDETLHLKQWFIQYLNTISTVQTRLCRNDEPNNIFENLIRGFIQLSDSQFGLIIDISYNRQGDSTHLVHAIYNLSWDDKTTASYQEQLKHGLTIKSEQDVFRDVIKSDKPTFIECDNTLTNLSQIIPGSVTMTTLMMLPISQTKSTITTLILANRKNGYNDTIIKPLTPLINVLKAIIFSAKRHQTIDKMTKYDALTGVFNRHYFEANFQNIIDNHLKSELKMALLVIDLQEFKKFNDTFGHHYGDELLTQFADRNKKLIKRGDTIARVGGDEFYILLHDLNDYEAASYVAKRLITACHEPYTIFGQTVTSTVAIGIVSIPLSGKTPESLMKRADFAMLEAKKSTKRWRFYSDDLEAKFYQKNDLEEGVRDALENNEFFFEYQPQVNIKNQEIVGLEALIRWHHPLKGLISPEQFVPIIEQLDLSETLNYHVITKVLNDLLHAKITTSKPIKLAINLSPNVENLVKHLNGLLRHINSFERPKNIQLELEVTESSFAYHKSNEDVQLDEIIKKLAKSNISLAIDDFGTKYSSILRLMAHDFKTIKIDRSFISQLSKPDNTKALAIVKSICSLSKDIGFELVAEGVENEAQLNILKDIGCQTIQGYFYYKPMSIKTLLATINHK